MLFRSINEDGYESHIEAQFLEAQDNVAPIIVDINLEPTKVAQKEMTKKSVTFKEKRIQFFFGFDNTRVLRFECVYFILLMSKFFSVF